MDPQKCLSGSHTPDIEHDVQKCLSGTHTPDIEHQVSDVPQIYMYDTMLRIAAAMVP